MQIFLLSCYREHSLFLRKNGLRDGPRYKRSLVTPYGVTRGREKHCVFYVCLA